MEVLHKSFQSFAKPVSYLALRTTRKKDLLPSGHLTSLQCHKMSIRRQGLVETAVTTLSVRQSIVVLMLTEKHN